MARFDDYATKFQTAGPCSGDSCRTASLARVIRIPARAAGGTGMRSTPAQWDRVYWEGKHLLMSLLDIEVPMHIIYPLLLGWNRGRYFLLTGQTLDARKALELGLVSELLPRPDLLPRAWALAEQIANQPVLLLRYTRVLFTQPLKRQLIDYLGDGLALEGMSVVDRTVTPSS